MGLTREKAKQTFDEIDFLTWQIDIINNCIDKIYDDFKEELRVKNLCIEEKKEAFELKSLAYDLLLESVKAKDEEIERLKEHITHLQNVYMKLDGKYLKLKTELEELKDNK